VASSGNVTTIALVTGALLLACGGDKGSSSDSGTSAACRASSSCGGDLAGSWNIKDVCSLTPPAAIAALCPQAQVDSSGLNVDGDATFQSSGMTYTSTATLSGALAFTVPTDCLTSNNFTCDELSTVVGGLVSEIGANVSGSCASASGGCACTITIPSYPTTGSGTYTTVGSMVTLIPTGATATSATYCATPSTLSTTIPINLGSLIGSVAAKLALTKP
jgi:hypothetical protein